MSFLENRNELMKTISRVYSSVLRKINKPPTLSYQASAIIINCAPSYPGDPATNSCIECLDIFMTEDFRTGPNYIKNLPYIEKIKNGVCNSQCICSVDAILLNTVIFTSQIEVNIGSTENAISPEWDAELDAMTDTVDREMGGSHSKYWRPGNKTYIKQILTRLSVSSTAEIQQNIRAVQTLQVGTGTYQSIRLTLMVDAIMKAMISNTVTASSLQTVVEKMQSAVKDYVDTDFKTGFAAAWVMVKKYVIIMGSVMGALLFILVLLLLRRASQPR